MAEPKQGRFKVVFTKTARRDYETIRDIKLIRGLNRLIEKLKENPYLFKKLAGPFGELRSAKTFSFRLLYQIEQDRLIVHVVSIEHRKDVYR
ncbi:MAG: hypothetical protein A3G87_03115 [Omnitrophica bacterium RIFCSPLOWO2_12_FULL_50_11]|nr:MAG: hypothetical protein A3G87_03115 [Omnitrophica bacterium RIFCSPLOWO2_12_FULL_50_11]